MIVEFVRDERRSFPGHEEPEKVSALRVWHCKYRSLSGLASFTQLAILVVATYPDSDLQPLADLSHLEYLSLLHMPKVSDLSPLQNLQQLRTLRLSTVPSWDPSGKKTIVESLGPLAALPNLAHLELFGVLPKDGSLRDLEESQSLVSVRVHMYRRSEQERFYRSTGLDDSLAPEPGVADWH